MSYSNQRERYIRSSVDGVPGEVWGWWPFAPICREIPGRKSRSEVVRHGMGDGSVGCSFVRGCALILSSIVHSSPSKPIACVCGCVCKSSCVFVLVRLSVWSVLDVLPCAVRNV